MPFNLEVAWPQTLHVSSTTEPANDQNVFIQCIVVNILIQHLVSSYNSGSWV